MSTISSDSQRQSQKTINSISFYFFVKPLIGFFRVPKLGSANEYVCSINITSLLKKTTIFLYQNSFFNSTIFLGFSQKSPLSVTILLFFSVLLKVWFRTAELVKHFIQFPAEIEGMSKMNSSEEMIQ